MYPDFWAEDKWKRSRRRAVVHDLLAAVTAHHDDLLSFDEVTQRLKPHRKPGHHTEMIEVAKIVGSVGRYRDFTREFLPRLEESSRRWLGLDIALNHLQPLPPIDVYKIGHVYFVQDGNHRVSVARANGLIHIEANVTELEIRVPLEPDDDPSDLIIRQEYLEFLEKTNLDKLRPRQRIEFTTPGRYAALLEVIDAHQAYLSESQGHAVPYEEAVVSWYDRIYCPMIEVIESHHLLNRFPGRTAADLYVWLLSHYPRLREEYGCPIDAAIAADLIDQLPDQGLGEQIAAVTRVFLERLQKIVTLHIH